MKKLVFILLLLICLEGYTFIACQQKTGSPEKAIAQTLLTQVDSFTALCKKLQSAAESDKAEGKNLQQIFLQTRLAYKSFEWAAEYFEPVTSRNVNGPPVEEVEVSGQVFEPAGLQVIEGFLFPAYDTTKKSDLLKQLAQLQLRCKKYKTHFSSIDMFDWQVFDAVKLEVFRIETLGITGFDNPLSLQSMNESAISLKSLQKVLSYYTIKENSEEIINEFNSAKNYLSSNQNFNSFNRMTFIAGYANPLTTGITDLENSLHIPVTRYNRLLNQDAKTLFDTAAFNINAYSPNPSSFVTPEKIALGKILFSDPILSGNGTRSCQSCHQPEKAFTDGLAKNIIIGSNSTLRRNTPTLINAALQPAQFYDLRANTLEDQSLDVVQSTLEMHGSMKLSVQKLWKDTTYQKLFAAAFPRMDRTGIDTLEIMNAIGSYVRSLTKLNSRFDDFMHGNKAALNNGEINGFNLFMGKAKCATCHYMPLFNGSFAPRYMKTEAEVIGVPQSAEKNEIDSDEGRYDIINVASFKHAFKTPTLRNAALTAPYMHNGVFSTLEQVMDFYNKGGGAGLGIDIENQTLPFDKLNLTQKESDDIIAFIKSLNSR